MDWRGKQKWNIWTALATIPVVFGKKTTHSTGPFKTSSLHLGIEVNNCQIDQSVAKGGSGTRHFSIGQRLIAWNYSGHSKWVPGTLRTEPRPLSYELEIEPKSIWRRHTEQLKDYHVPVTEHSPVSHTVIFIMTGIILLDIFLKFFGKKLKYMLLP